jgi:hypothetical protein
MSCFRSWPCRIVRRLVRTILTGISDVVIFPPHFPRAVDGMSKRELEEEMRRIELAHERNIADAYGSETVASLVSHRLMMDRYEALHREWLRRWSVLREQMNEQRERMGNHG